MIRVLLVEASRPAAALLETLLQRDGGLEVVGWASDAQEALFLARRQAPQVVALGLHDLRDAELVGRIMEELPTPVVVMPAGKGEAIATASFRALELGAVSVFSTLPEADDPRLDELARALAETLRAMAGVKLVTRRPSGTTGNTGNTGNTAFFGTTIAADLEPDKADLPRLLLVAASTGGPQALAALLRDLPANFPLPVLVVQHISPGFVHGMADWLSESCRLEVRVARAGDDIVPGLVLVAPDDQHLLVEQFGARLMVVLDGSEPVSRHRPSADPLFSSAARVLGRRAIGVVLTGMGADGARGLAELRAAGAATLVQEPRSCVVDSMPRAAMDAGAVAEVLPLAQLGRRLRQLAVTPVLPAPPSGGARSSLMSLDPVQGSPISGQESGTAYKAVREGGKP